MKQQPMGGNGKRLACRKITGPGSGVAGARFANTCFSLAGGFTAGGIDVGPAVIGASKPELHLWIDRELRDGFFAEAGKLLLMIDRQTRLWSCDWSNPLYRQNLLEGLHTLKGGALLCRLNGVCRQVHQFEAFLAEVQVADAAPSGLVLRELRARRAELQRALELARVTLEPGRAWNDGVTPDLSIPFSRVLPRLHAVVRQLGNALGKPVQLHANDPDVEFDAGVLRRLAVPLEHVLRDAVFHGIETLGHRRACGKRATGRIDLRIALLDRDVVVEVEDDGRGIDAARVRELAVSSGFLAKEASLDDREYVRFVFAPSLSTVGAVRRTCGRGIGLSAAQTGVARLSGHIDVSSRLGLGTCFVVRIPREVRVERALLFSYRNDRYAISDRFLDKVVPVYPIVMEMPADSRDFDFAGTTWELRCPGEYLGDYGRIKHLDRIATVMLLLRCGERRVALCADAVRDCQDVLVRQSTGSNRVAAGVSLATLLDDGGAVIFLDSMALFGSANSRGPTVV